MFSNCSSLTTAPELPAATLTNDCYNYMFSDCSSLTTTPELPATVLAMYCYAGMFYGCSSLTTAPELPATALAEGCYSEMFQNCSKLSTITMLATDISAGGCLSGWVKGVASTGIFYKNKDMHTLPTGVNGIPEGWTVQNYGDVIGGKPYFAIESLEDNNSISFTNDVYYSLNNNKWTLLSKNEPIVIGLGDLLYLKGNLTPTTTTGIGTFSISGNCNLKGNIMSLLYGDNFEGQVDLTGKDNAFYLLFNGCLKNISASTLLLPATTLSNNCYNSMFRNCSNLISAPELPATTLAYGCYSGMFSGCINLTTAPELPATTLAEYCYEYMFSGCSNLTVAPELPATTLATYCYSGMFSNCTNLTTTPKLPATTLANNCYQYMFQDCSRLTTAPELPATTLVGSCYDSMFSGCSNLTVTPELPATTLANNCYQYMFYGCSNLTVAPELPATTLAINCYAFMFQGCTKLSTITMLGVTDYETDYLSFMTQWVYGVASTGTFYKNPEMTLLSTGVNGVPEGWTVKNYNEVEWIPYLTFEALEDGFSASLTINDCEYRVNNGQWKILPKDEYTVAINKGQTLSFKGNLTPVSTTGIGSFSTTGKFNAKGNVMSMLYGDNFEGQTNLTGKTYAFYRMFYNCTKLIDASELILPATILSIFCYSEMFWNCSSLIATPELPATTLANNCYKLMFYNCSSLTTAPELPAWDLSAYCYSKMFQKCTSLIKAPELPATYTVNYCYENMFDGCTSLANAPELPATSLDVYSYQYMFQNCTSLTVAPELPAETVPNYCYRYMFKGCSKLSTITMLATTLGQRYPLNMWVSGVASNGVFIKHPDMTSLSTGNNGIPEGWTVVDYV